MADNPYLNYSGTANAQTTTNAYADVKLSSAASAKALQWALEGKQKGTIAVRNSGANAIHFQVVGSLDNGKTFPVLVSAADVAVAAGATVGFNWAATGASGAAFGVYTHLKVQVKAAVGGSQGAANVQGAFTT